MKLKFSVYYVVKPGEIYFSLGEQTTEAEYAAGPFATHFDACKGILALRKLESDMESVDYEIVEVEMTARTC